MHNGRQDDRRKERRKDKSQQTNINLELQNTSNSSPFFSFLDMDSVLFDWFNEIGIA